MKKKNVVFFVGLSTAKYLPCVCINVKDPACRALEHNPACSNYENRNKNIISSIYKKKKIYDSPNN